MSPIPEPNQLPPNMPMSLGDELDPSAFENLTLQRLQLFFYLVPVFGALPALWTLNDRKSSRRHRNTSRLALTLALVWALGCGLLNLSGGGETGGAATVMVLNTLFTSGYFLINLWLMAQLWQNQPLQVPGVSQVAKHLP